MKFVIIFCAILAVGAANNSLFSNTSRLSKALKPGRIVGGYDVSIDSVPYQVSLRSWNFHFCGGSVISLQNVLTAGHCVYRVMIESLTIRAGSTDNRFGGQVIQVKNATIHPNYIPGYEQFDAAILFLETRLDDYYFSIAVIPLPTHEPTDGTQLFVTGWGQIEENGPTYPILQGVYVTVMNYEKCKRQYTHFRTVTESMFCAGHYQGGKDSCVGDSGGPIVADNVLYGIVSWGEGCGRSDRPGVYTNVYYILAWIKANIAKS